MINSLIRLLKKNLWVLLPVVIVLCSGAAAYWMVQQSGDSKTAGISDCQGGQASQFSCWQSRYNTMVATQSPQAAFVDFKANYETNSYVKSNCHQIGHVIGRAAAQRYKTLSETYKQGDQFCWSGYYHGSIETIAQDIGPDKIMSQLTSVCAEFIKTSQYSFDHYNCVHGMGHGLMALKEDNLFTALKGCDLYDDSWQRESCYGGVFMENVMNEINPGEQSDYLKKDDPLYPCTVVQDKYKQQCYLMQTSHALTVVNNDYSRVFELCGGLAAPFDTTCYQSLGRDVSGQSSSNQAKTVELCMLGQTAVARQHCFTGAVKDYISYFHSDKEGLAMCNTIPDATLSASCIAEAGQYYRSF